MYTQMNVLAGKPTRLDAAVRYMEDVRLDLENQRGSRGAACLVNPDLGTCVVAAFWDSLYDMTSSEQAVQHFRSQLVKRLRGTVIVEHYQGPVFVRRSRPRDGAAVRLSHFGCTQAGIDTAIEEFRSTGVPALLETPGICSAHMMTDRLIGRCVVATAWEDIDAMGASRSATARLRASRAAVTHAQIRSVEEYRLVFSSVRDGIALDGGVWVTPLAGYGYHQGERLAISYRPVVSTSPMGAATSPGAGRSTRVVGAGQQAMLVA